MEEFQIYCETSWLLMESTLSRMDQNMYACVKACFAGHSYVIRLHYFVVLLPVIMVMIARNSLLFELVGRIYM